MTDRLYCEKCGLKEGQQFCKECLTDAKREGAIDVLNRVIYILNNGRTELAIKFMVEDMLEELKGGVK